METKVNECGGKIKRLRRCKLKRKFEQECTELTEERLVQGKGELVRKQRHEYEDQARELILKIGKMSGYCRNSPTCACVVAA